MPAPVVIDLSPLGLPPCGIRRSVAGLISELPRCCAAAGVPLRGFSYRSLRAPRPADLSSVHLPLPRRLDPAIAALALVERRSGPGLFHATDFYLPLHAGSAMLATVHDVIYAIDPEATPQQAQVERGMRRHLAQVVRAICCSQHSAERFCAHYGYPEERTEVVPWGIDTALFRPAPAAAPAPSGRPYFLAVSCNEKRKNTPRLVRAFLRYAGSGGRHDLRLAWRLPAPLRAEVRRAGLAARVHELGVVDDAALIGLYRHAVAALFPSLHEGFGFPVLEALACGTPVMTTRRTSLPEVGGDLALYVDGEDIDEMVRCLHALERGEPAARLARCRHEGPAWARRFTWRRCAEGTLETYLRAASAVRPATPRPGLTSPVAD